MFQEMSHRDPKLDLNVLQSRVGVFLAELHVLLPIIKKVYVVWSQQVKQSEQKGERDVGGWAPFSQDSAQRSN